MYRFLFTSRWLGYLALAAFFAAVCTSLGLWQMDRRDAIVQNINRINANYSAPPIDFATAKPFFQQFDQTKEWTQVSLTGTYDQAGQRIVRNRPSNGQPGYEVTIPFRLASGESVIIDRGWLPIGDLEAGRPDAIPAPPQGTVTVVGRLKPSEPQVARGAPAGQIPSIYLPAYAQELNYPLMTGAYLQMASESPAAAVNPAGFAMPSVVEGSNLSYAMQWFAFGVLFFVGYGYVAVQQARINRLEAEGLVEEEEESLGRSSAFQPSLQNTLRAAKKNQQRRRPTAEEEEDSMLDAQGFEGGVTPMKESVRER